MFTNKRYYPNPDSKQLKFPKLDQKLEFPKLGKFVGSGSYGMVIQKEEEKKTETKTPNVYKILMNFRDEDREKKTEKIETFEREIFITEFLYRLANERPDPKFPNPFVSVKSKTDKDGPIKIDLKKFKDKLDEDQQTNFDTKSPVSMYEMGNAGMPILDFLESRHKSVCKCDNKLKCDIYTNLEIEFIIKLAELLQDLQTKYKFVHGDLSSNNVMVKDGNIMFIDVGNAYVKIGDEEMKCDTCYAPVTCFNDRRDLFTFLTSLINYSCLSEKLTEFIEYFPSCTDKETFSYCLECELYQKLCGHKIIWDNIKTCNDSEYTPEKCLLFTPVAVIGLFKKFKRGIIEYEVDFAQSCKIADVKELVERIADYKKKSNDSIQKKVEIIKKWNRALNIDKECTDIKALAFPSIFRRLFIPEKVRKEMADICNEKLIQAMADKKKDEDGTGCMVSFKSSKKTSKKSSKKTSKKSPKKSSKKTSKKTSKKSSKKSPKIKTRILL